MEIIEIANPFLAPVYHEKIVSSTMDVSRKLAAEGLPHGTVITADFQTAGRGRGAEGRRLWEMDRGSLAFTVLLRFSSMEEIPRALTLLAGLAVSLAIEDFLPALSGSVLIKWPNDVMLSRFAGVRDPAENVPAGKSAKKAVGILVEANGGTARLGIGINVTQKFFPGHLRDKAASLSMAAGVNIEPEARFDLLEKCLRRLYSALDDSNGDWRGLIETRLYKKGERVTFIEGLAGSSAAITGRLTGIGPDGELLLTPEDLSTPRAFFTGELQVY